MVTAGTRAGSHGRKAIFVQHRCSLEPLALTSCMQLCSLLHYACSWALKIMSFLSKAKDRERESERERDVYVYGEMSESVVGLCLGLSLGPSIKDHNTHSTCMAHISNSCVSLHIFSSLTDDISTDLPVNESFFEHCRCLSRL